MARGDTTTVIIGSTGPIHVGSGDQHIYNNVVIHTNEDDD